MEKLTFEDLLKEENLEIIRVLDFGLESTIVEYENYKN